MVKKAEKNKNLMILLSILAIAVILIVGVFYYFVVLGEETEKTIEILKNYNVKKIVTQCPHCFNTLKNEYPQSDEGTW